MRVTDIRFVLFIRFIPARAGNTTHDIPEGSSSTCSSRFIPARAGNTYGQAAIDPPGWPVHPRPRGEHCSHKILIQKLLLLT